MNKKIELTQQELDEIKVQAADEGAFKSTVLSFIKKHEKAKIFDRITTLEVKTGFQWWLISGVYIALLGLLVWAIKFT